MELALVVIGGWFALCLVNSAVQSWRCRIGTIHVGGQRRLGRSLTSVRIDGGRVVERRVVAW